MVFEANLFCLTIKRWKHPINCLF